MYRLDFHIESLHANNDQGYIDITQVYLCNRTLMANNIANNIA